MLERSSNVIMSESKKYKMELKSKTLEFWNFSIIYKTNALTVNHKTHLINFFLICQMDTMKYAWKEKKIKIDFKFLDIFNFVIKKLKIRIKLAQ